jgi:hypothetical protein
MSNAIVGDRAERIAQADSRIARYSGQDAAV